MTSPRHDLTPLPDLLNDAARAGPVRTRRPVYTDLLPPCNAGCPAGENIQACLAQARNGEHERAWRQLTADNPLPAIHGRACYHPCESVCNRAELDWPVSIHSVERFLGDLANDRERATGSADVVMTTSALLRHGPQHARVLLDGLAAWMARKGFGAIGEFRGMMAAADGSPHYDRIGYLTAVEQASRAYGPR